MTYSHCYFSPKLVDDAVRVEHETMRLREGTGADVIAYQHNLVGWADRLGLMVGVRVIDF